MIKIKIDGKNYEVAKGKNLLEVALSLGLNVPHFCYHAALGSVGACRLCAVKKYKDETDNKGKLIMSCMEPVDDGMIVTIQDDQSKQFRKEILESLMLNHPHDCPVCDEGGECHLQDMTVMTGHAYRNHPFKKRTHANQYLGPFIHHEMNRCIQCYRCVRFYKDYAGGKDLNVFSAHDHVYFGRKEEGVLESEFSGNLVEVCPTGVFTDKTLKNHFTRKWDMTNAPSICVHCSVGCNTIAGERYGVLRRVMSRYNGSVNGYFLCDRGRFGYEFVNGSKRIREAMVRTSKNDKQDIADNDRIQQELTEALGKKEHIIGIGSPRASLEANFALLQLVGENNFYHGVPDRTFEITRTAHEILQQTPAHIPSLKDIEKSDAVVILGEDLTNTAPMVALAVRQAARNSALLKGEKAGIPHWHDAAQRTIGQDTKSPVFVANPFTTKLDELSEKPLHASIDEIAAVGFALAPKLNDKAKPSGDPTQEHKQLIGELAETLKNADNPVIITGVHPGSEALLKAAADIASGLISISKRASLLIVMPEANSMGLGMMPGGSFGEALKSIKGGKAETMIVLENDLYRNANREMADQVFDRCSKVVVLDHTKSRTTEKADIVIPVGTFAESEGTLVSSEARAQRFYRVFPLEKSVFESWRVIGEMFKILKETEETPWKTFDLISKEMGEKIPVFAEISQKMPKSKYRVLNEKIKRQTLRFSGRTAIHANVAVSETEPPFDPDSPLAFTMEGATEKPPSSLIPYYWKPGWNSPQSLNFYLNEPNGSMKGGDPGIRLIEGTARNDFRFYEPVEDKTGSRKGTFQIFPVYTLFGSEELSSKARAVRERVPKPFVLVNPKDAKGSPAILTISDEKIEVVIKTDEKVPEGTIGLSVYLPGMPYLNLPDRGTMSFTNENGDKSQQTGS